MEHRSAHLNILGIELQNDAKLQLLYDIMIPLVKHFSVKMRIIALVFGREVVPNTTLWLRRFVQELWRSRLQVYDSQVGNITRPVLGDQTAVAAFGSRF